MHAYTWQIAYDRLLPAHHLDTLTPASLTPWWASRLRRAGSDADVLVADAEGTVIGYAVAHGRRVPDPAHDEWQGWAGEVSSLYVHPLFQGYGFGGQLLNKALAGLQQQGYLWVLVGVLEANERARRFYERHGLRFDGSRWEDRHFGVPLVSYAKALSCVVDFRALRLESGSVER